MNVTREGESMVIIIVTEIHNELLIYQQINK